MKQHFLLLALMLVSLASNAQQPDNEIWYTTSDGNAVNYNAGSIPIVSNTYENGMGIISFNSFPACIDNEAFYGCSSLTSITLPSSIMSIGIEAFYGCSSLTSITLPSNITSIGYYAFQNCSSLASITLPRNLTSIGNSAFKGCSSLASITLPSSITSIGYQTFQECSSLTAVNCLATVPPTIFSDVFESNTTINVPEESLAAYQAADGWKNCTIKALPNTTVLYSATDDISAMFNAYNFYGALADANVTDLGEGNYMAVFQGRVKAINDNSFKECTSLTSITIPDGVTVIGISAFTNCTGLTSVNIPNTVTTIGNDAFRGCTGLLSITVSGSISSIESYAFAGCTSLESVSIQNTGYLTLEANVFNGCTSLYSLTVSGSSNLNSSIVDNCSGLLHVTIGAGTSPHNYQYFHTNSWTDMTFLETEPAAYASLDGLLFPNGNRSSTAQPFYIYVPDGSANAYREASDWKKLIDDYDVTITDEYPVSVTLNSAGYATFSANHIVEIKTEGVKAYKAAVEGETITLAELDGYIPAGTGVLLYGEGKGGATVKFRVVPKGGAPSNLAGNCLQATTVESLSLVNGYISKPSSGTVWALGNGNQFLKYTGNRFAGNRAFLIHEVSSQAPMRMIFSDGGTTLVEDMPMPEQKAVKRIENGQIIIVRGAQKYNLAGQKIGTIRE